MEGIGTNKFVYNGIGNAYIQCFFFATKTAISIGKNPKVNTENNAQIVFMLFAWLFGVFVFAVLVGQIKEIIAQSTRSQDEYKKIFDNISQYMIRMQIGQVRSGTADTGRHEGSESCCQGPHASGRIFRAKR